MADVFISYSHENKEAARMLADTITAKGYNVWWDRELIGGDDYTTVIEGVLDEAKAVIVLWSDISRKSYWVRDEAAVGRDRNRLLPIVIDKCQPPLGFRQLHTVFLHGWDGKSDEPLEDLWLGLEGLVHGGRGQSEAASAAPTSAPDTNPFGGPLEVAPEPQAAGAPPAPPRAKTRPSAPPKLEASPERVHKILAGVNAQPNNKPIAKILREEKKQRSFLKTFWLTSFVVSAILSAAMGFVAIFMEKDENIADMGHIELLLGFGILAFFMCGLGLILGRFLIVVGRRLSKRKSVKYFDSVTNWCMGVSLAIAGLIAWGMTTVEGEDGVAVGDAIYFAPLMAFVFFFPIAAFITVPIGAAKGVKRKSFQDGY